MNNSQPTLNITPLLHKVRNRVYRVGVELEGGWTKLPKGIKKLEHDGSVVFPASEMIDNIAGIYKFQKGELPSPALIPTGVGSDNKLTLERWMRSHYADKINSTCGMHCHMSFANAFQYQSLMREEFLWTMVTYLKQWADQAVIRGVLPKDHWFFDRLAGKSEYCQLQFFADGQAQRTRKDHDHHGKDHRYTAIHYAFSRLGTIEVRLLPMMPNVDLAIELIRETMAITSAFLVTVAKQENLLLDGRVASKGEPEILETWIAEGDPIESERLSVSA